MAFEPSAYQLAIDELAEDNSFALALRAGRLVATVVSKKSGKHVTVQLRAKRREGKRFRACELVEAERVYIDTPRPDGGGTEIGCLHLVGKWAGKILPPWQQDFDQARLWSARRILDVAHGRAPVVDDKAEILEGKVCLACGRELTEPESIARNIGPECWKRVTGLGADAGEHQAPGEQLDLEEGNAEDGAMGISEAEVIANDARHADIEKIAVEECGFDMVRGHSPEAEQECFDEAERRYRERAARGEVKDPVAFGKECASKTQAQSEAEIREQLEAELQETVKPPAGEEPEALPAAPPAAVEGFVLLRAGEDPRRLLDEASP